MPRPTEVESKNVGGVCASKTVLERILIGATALAILVIIVLLFLVAKRQVDFGLKYCNTTTCLVEASKVTSYVDPATNPCNDFYQFACGTFLKNAHGDEQLDLPKQLHLKRTRELFEAYTEPIKSDEHKMVKTAKKLFRACMNESAIETDYLNTIKEVIKAAGGWPVVEGSKWNEGTFDWASTTYKLRELGYYYTIFLDLNIQLDPDNSTKYILKVTAPYMWDHSTLDFDKVGFMTEVATMFGAEDRSKAMDEMAQAQEFLTRLQLEIHNWYGRGTSGKFTIKDYQKKCTTLNWLEFINKLAISTEEVSENDYVVFPPPEQLKSWIDLISRTPKRTQANYMIWKVIEGALPYLTKDLQKRGQVQKQQARKEFCLQEIQTRFKPSPIDVLCARRYLPKEKKEKVEEVAQNIKSQLIAALEKSGWIDQEDKQQVLQKAKAIRVVIGQPGNYFEDDILDNLDVDMIEINTETFLGLLAQVDRNRITIWYRQINKPFEENLFEKQVFSHSLEVPFYSHEDNIIYVPTVSVSEFLFDEKRPNYLNYGALGVQLGQQLGSVVYLHLRQHGQEKLDCMEKALEDYQLKYEQFQVEFAAHMSISEKISYAAYENWTKSHGEEQHLITIEYAPKQLFWISAVSTFCQPIRSYGYIQGKFNDPKQFSSLISGSLRNNPQFANDFKCPKGSKMNPSKRCQFI